MLPCSRQPQASSGAAAAASPPRGNDLAFGEFGLQASEAAWMTNRQIEAARRVMTRFVRRGGQVFIRVFPDKSVTKKPAETRIGRCEGNARRGGSP